MTEVARAMGGTDTPDDAQRKRAERKLARLTRDGFAHHFERRHGPSGEWLPARYYAAETVPGMSENHLGHSPRTPPVADATTDNLGRASGPNGENVSAATVPTTDTTTDAPRTRPPRTPGVSLQGTPPVREPSKVAPSRTCSIPARSTRKRPRERGACRRASRSPVLLRVRSPASAPRRVALPVALVPSVAARLRRPGDDPMSVHVPGWSIYIGEIEWWRAPTARPRPETEPLTSTDAVVAVRAQQARRPTTEGDPAVGRGDGAVSRTPRVPAAHCQTKSARSE